MRNVTVILPCAGKGTRLGLPFPKELAPLHAGEAVIDSCLSMIRKADAHCRIVLMDDGDRSQTRSYIRRKLPDVPLAVVQQHLYAADFPDAIIKLEPWFGDVNIVMLPDAVYESAGEPVSQLTDLAAESGFALAACRVSPDVISSAGALAVSQDNIIRYYDDKPGDPAPFNAVWGMLGFSGPIGLAGLRVIASVTRKIMPGKSPVTGAPVLWLDGYRDCGTWEGYMNELRRVF